MTFNDITRDTENKYKVLTHLEKLYYNNAIGILSVANTDDNCIIIDDIYKKKIVSYYKKYLWLNKNEACEKCRVQKQNLLKEKMNEILKSLDR